MAQTRTPTSGNIIVENLQIGQTIYEYREGVCTTFEIISKPKLDTEAIWRWEAKRKDNGKARFFNAPFMGGIASGPNIYDWAAFGGV